MPSNQQIFKTFLTIKFDVEFESKIIKIQG